MSMLRELEREQQRQQDALQAEKVFPRCPLWPIVQHVGSPAVPPQKHSKKLHQKRKNIVHSPLAMSFRDGFQNTEWGFHTALPEKNSPNSECIFS